MVLLFLCWPLSRWRFAIVAAMGVGFIGACVLLGPLFGLSPLSGRAWTLLGVFAAATPALMCLFVFLVSRVKQRLDVYKRQYLFRTKPFLYRKKCCIIVKKLPKAAFWVPAVHARGGGRPGQGAQNPGERVPPHRTGERFV